jgi:hypothetical protein
MCKEYRIRLLMPYISSLHDNQSPSPFPPVFPTHVITHAQRMTPATSCTAFSIRTNISDCPDHIPLALDSRKIVFICRPFTVFFFIACIISEGADSSPFDGDFSVTTMPYLSIFVWDAPSFVVRFDCLSAINWGLLYKQLSTTGRLL